LYSRDERAFKTHSSDVFALPPSRRHPAQAARRRFPLHAGTLDRADHSFNSSRLALDKNPAESAVRCVVIGRKNYLFAGSDAGGRRPAAMYFLVESTKLNDLNPQHYVATFCCASPIAVLGGNKLFRGTGEQLDTIPLPLELALIGSLRLAVPWNCIRHRPP
jgi:hypothetical protein